MQKSFVIFAAVVLICQAAKVPQDVTHQVMVPVPSEVLAAPPPPARLSPLKDKPKTEIPAQIVEVAKDHVHKVDEEENRVPTTAHPTRLEITSMPKSSMGKEIQRKTRAVPFTDNESIKHHAAKHTDMNMMKPMWGQRKLTMGHKMGSHRSMRSAVKAQASTAPPVTVAQVPATKNPAVKSLDSSTSMSSTIGPCDLLCTKFEFDPICATNGLCLHEFPNQCILETYNCKHSKGKFSATKDGRCQMHWLEKCDESEMI